MRIIQLDIKGLIDMKNYCLLIIISFFINTIFIQSINAANKAYYIPKIETHLIKSKYVDQTFEISVWLPISKKDGSERFPVLYVTDANTGLPMGDMMHYMHIGGDAPRFIMVGIGYPVTHALGGSIIRRRDMTPTEELTAPNLIPIDGIPKVLSGKKSGGAAEFLQFIRQELIPYVDKKYNTIPGDRALFGDSLGGLFALYTLFHETNTFNRYIIGSPSIWYDNEISLKYAEKFMASDKKPKARIYMSIGELEEEPHQKMVTNVYRMQAILNSKPTAMPDLKIKMQVIPNETHTSVIAINLIRGIQEVFDRPSCNFMIPGCGK